MVFKKSILLFTALVFLFSCSHMEREKVFVREPAQDDSSCQELAKSLFLKNNYDSDLQKALVDKKLISLSNKFVTVERPSLNWINKARISLNQSIKNWNNNKYPAFYIFNDEDVVTEARKYFQTLHSIVSPDIAVDPTATKNLALVESWMKSFAGYQKELDQLLEERISLQYNLSLLKKLKLKKDEVRDIKISVKRKGVMVDEILTLRKSDKDLDYQLKKFSEEIKNLDGTLLRNGRIKERIIRQAMLADMLTIIQREFEYALKNTKEPSAELVKEFEELNLLMAKSEFQPSTYGVYRITNKVFIRELAALTKVDVAYKTFVETPLMKLKEVVNAFIENRAIKKQTEEEKVGIFKRIYTKVTSITARQAAVLGGGVSIVGLGAERYFSINNSSFEHEERSRIEEIGTEEAKPQSTSEARAEDIQGTTHTEQLERTKKEEARRSQEHSEVIEVHVDELSR